MVETLDLVLYPIPEGGIHGGDKKTFTLFYSVAKCGEDVPSGFISNVKLALIRLK